MFRDRRLVKMFKNGNAEVSGLKYSIAFLDSKNSLIVYLAVLFRFLAIFFLVCNRI